MSRRVPVTAAKKVAVEQDFDQVIILGWRKSDASTHVITYGKTKADCGQAAVGGKKLAAHLGLTPDVASEKKP